MELVNVLCVVLLLLLEALSDNGVRAAEQRVRTTAQRQESIAHQSRYFVGEREGEVAVLSAADSIRQLQAPSRPNRRRRMKALHHGGVKGVKGGMTKGPNGGMKLKGEVKTTSKAGKIQKKSTELISSEGCDGLLQFDEAALGEYREGDLSRRGERTLWSSNPLFDMDGDIIGSVAGMCTAMADSEAVDKSASASDGKRHRGGLFCNEYYRWTSGVFEGSTLVAEGIYPKSANSATYTILGGSGCFAGKAGIVKTQYIEETDSHRALIQFFT